MGTFFLSTVTWITMICLVRARMSGSQKLPNILIMMADDLGIGDVGCFGNTTLRTPHLDGLASDGVKLTQHLAAASVCTPSRSAFLTGRYPIRSGMAPGGVVSVITFLACTAGLPPSEVTFAEIAKEAGYSTALIGKWHLGLSCEKYNDSCHHPMKQGFDYYYGIPLTNLRDFGGEGDLVILSHAPYIRHQILLTTSVILVCTFYLHKKGILGGFFTGSIMALFFLAITSFFLYFLDFTQTGSLLMREYDVVEQPIRLQNLTKRFVLEGQEFLRNRHEDGRPFLLFLSWSHVHTFLDNMAEFVGRSQHGRYGDAVEELDWGVGQILQTLDTLGFTDDTLVYFTSDNGGHLEEMDLHGHRNGGHNGIYRGGKSHGAADGGIRVPTIVRWPGVIPAGTISDEPTSLMDLLPTIASAINRPLPTDKVLDGRDLRPLLSGKTHVSSHDFLFHYFGSRINAVRYRPRTGFDVYKLVLARPNYLPGKEMCTFVCSSRDIVFLEQPELYNVAKDPSEKHPLDHTNVAEYRQIKEAMYEAIQTHQSGIVPAQKQLTLLNLVWRPWMQPCCNFPYCRCQDQKFNGST